MKAAQRQFLVKIQGIEGYWMTKSGGNSSSDVTKAFDGGTNVPDLMASPRDLDNITVTRGFDPIRDGALLRNLRSKVGVFETTITVTPTDRDYAAQDQPIVYSPCLLAGVTEPEVDASSGDLSTYELSFAVSDVR